MLLRSSVALLALTGQAVAQSVTCSMVPADTPQLPNLLDKYGANRPPFDVPGVDYYVGRPSAIAQKDPTAAGALPTCASYSAPSHSVSIAVGSRCVLDGYDFKTAGIMVKIPAGVLSTTLTNDSFGRPDLWTIDRRGGDFTLTHSTFEGAGFIPYFDLYGGGGKTDIEYNDFHNIDGDALDFSAGVPSTLTVAHNAFRDIGMLTGTHPDAVQMLGIEYDNSRISYNLVYKSAAVGMTSSAGLSASQGWATVYSQIHARTPCTGCGFYPIFNPGFLIDHNVIIADAKPAGVTLSFGLMALAATPATAFRENYLDMSGAYGPIYPSGNPTCVGNVSMTTGLPIAGAFGPVTCK